MPGPAAGFTNDHKTIVSDGNHRTAASILFFLKTGNDQMIQFNTNPKYFPNSTPAKSPVKFPPIGAPKK
ncbi:hypothetical protein SAMN05216311_11911 [Chitinophaga sp. CF418]|nr:hypothetical protein SAMN05216311_11911 [Chitinophaga sp. CF418]